MQTKQLSNLEAEQCILGAVLVDSISESDVTEKILNTLTVEDFDADSNKIIFLCMKRLYDRGVNIDFVTVLETLDRAGDLKKCGGVEYLTYLTNVIPGNANYIHYLSIVKDYSNLRKIQKIAQDIEGLIAQGNNATSVKRELESKVENLNEESQKSSVRHIGEQSEAMLQHIKDLKNGKHDDFGLETGFKTLDRLLWGLQKSELYIIAARAGVGKTAFAVNILNYVAKTKNVLFFSQEMSEREILYRMFSHESAIALPEVRKAKSLSDEQMQGLESAAEAFKKGKFYIDDSPLTVAEMTTRAKRLKRKEGLDLVFLDYLQFVKPTNKSGNRALEVGEIARDLKRMARIVDIPVVALCQLNRQLDTEDREPTLADLRESGEIENNADVVIFLTNSGSRLEKIRRMDLIIAKHRNGALAKIKFKYRGETFTFWEEAADTSKKEKLLPVQEELPF